MVMVNYIRYNYSSQFEMNLKHDLWDFNKTNRYILISQTIQ